MKAKDERYPDYPLFKGLQRPLEMMGLQGRYIYWAAAAAGGGLCRLHHRLLPAGVRGRAGRTGGRPVHGCRAHHPQAAERVTQQEKRPGRVCVCVLAQGLKRETITAMCCVAN